MDEEEGEFHVVYVNYPTLCFHDDNGNGYGPGNALRVILLRFQSEHPSVALPTSRSLYRSDKLRHHRVSRSFLSLSLRRSQHFEELSSTD